MTAPRARTVLRFHGFGLDLDRGRLLDPTGAERPLRHKCFNLLRHLAENAERAVSREELLDAVWPGIFVGDDSVTQCIAEIRRALGDAGQHLLKTLPKRGYVLAAPVSRCVAQAPPAPPPPADGPPPAAVPADDVPLGRLTGVASRSADRIEAFLESYLVSEHDPGTVPFGGRDRALEDLDAWLDDAEAEPRLLLVAPAGRGKSALLARWAWRLAATGRTGEGEGWWRLAFVPISLRFGTNRPAVFFEAVAARVAEILGADLPPARAEPAEHYAAQCRRLLAEAAARRERVLIVLDGVDEALGGRFDAAWFPRRPGSRLRLLLSARRQVGDRDARDWVARLGWDGADRVRVRDLAPLAPEGVLDLLRRAGGPAAARPGTAARLHDLTAGEPLLLRLHVEELCRRGDHPEAPDAGALASVAPGLRGYFDAWLDRQRAAWAAERADGAPIDEALLDAHLAVLACAHGPLSAEELGGLVQRVHALPAGFRVERALHPLRRFVIGADRGARGGGDGYVLSHPRLGEFLREDYLDAHRIVEVRRAFAAWGREALRGPSDGPPAPVSPYLLQFLGQHLEDAGEPAAAFMGLVEEGWLRAWEAFEGDHRGFAADVRRAERAAAGEVPADGRAPLLGWRLRCALVLSSTVGMGAQVPTDLLLDCVAAGVVHPGQALAWLDGRPDRAGALVELSPLLPEALLPETLAVARSVPAGHERAEALAALAEYLPPTRREAVRAEALNAARSVEDAALLAATLAGLADRLPDTDRIELLAEAFARACAAEADRDRAEALVVLAPDLPEHSLSRAFAAACALSDGRDRARAVAAVAGRLSGPAREGGLAEALAAARAVVAPEQRAGLLSALARALPEAVRPGVFAEALAAVHAIDDGWRRSEALAELAESLPPSLLPEALSSVRAIGSPWQRARALAACGDRLEEPARAALLAEALGATRAIGSEDFRSERLAELIPVLPPSLRAEALAGARAMEDVAARAAVLVALVEADPEWAGLPAEAATAAREVRAGPLRAGLLARLARQLAGSGRADLLAEALAAARAPGDECPRAAALAALADHLPAPRHAQILGDALAVLRDATDEAGRAQIVADLVGRTPLPERGRILEEALAVARAIAHPFTRARALTLLAGLRAGPAGADVFEEALATARLVPGEDGYSRVLALAEVAAALPAPIPADLASELLDFVRTLGHEGSRAIPLKKLAPVLSPARLEEALAIARTPPGGRGRDDRARADLLLTLAALLPEAVRGGVLSTALDAARAVRHHQQRAEALGAVADALPEAARRGVSVEALTAARAIAGAQFRAQALGGAAARLPEPDRGAVHAEALAVAAAIADDWGRAAALVSLAPSLPAALLPAASAAARGIGEDRQRAAALAALAGRAQGPTRDALLAEALDAARSVEDALFRAEALAALVGWLEGSLQAEALRTFLECAGTLARPDLLARLPAFLPVIARLDPPEGLHEVHRALCDVGEWFG